MTDLWPCGDCGQQRNPCACWDEGPQQPPPPARSRADAEEAIAGMLAEHRHKPIHETETFRGVRESYQVGVGCRCGWGSEGGYQEDDQRAHVAEVIMPAIREAIAQEIEALVKPRTLSDTALRGYEFAIEDASRIVRGGTP